MKLYSPSTIKDIRERYGFKLTKSLGQNFLTDKNIIDKIIEGSHIEEDDLVIEIGPGIGVITYEASLKAKKVVAVEIDTNLLPILEETLGDRDNIEIINADILKTDVNRIIGDMPTDCVKVIGNLPYYITTPIIMKLLEEGVRAQSITVMMQKEVADRIMSAPGKKTYGALSVAVQYYCEVSTVTAVPKEVFVPMPQVDSTVLRLDIRKKKAVEVQSEALFFACVKAGFGQRRKTLLNSLMGVEGMTKEKIKASLDAAGIDSSRRAETLNLEEFAQLSNQIFLRL